MIDSPKKKELEDQLKRYNHSFWINIVFILMNVSFYFFLKEWLFIAIIAVLAFGCYGTVLGSKRILRELGREEEI